jgi:hypothetical protein
VTEVSAPPQKIAVVLRDGVSRARPGARNPAVAGPDLVLAGSLAVVGARNAVDKTVTGAVLHP